MPVIFSLQDLLDGCILHELHDLLAVVGFVGAVEGNEGSHGEGEAGRVFAEFLFVFQNGGQHADLEFAHRVQRNA